MACSRSSYLRLRTSPVWASTVWSLRISSATSSSRPLQKSVISESSTGEEGTSGFAVSPAQSLVVPEPGLHRFAQLGKLLEVADSELFH
jgi:hypothetical protein